MTTNEETQTERTETQESTPDEARTARRARIERSVERTVDAAVEIGRAWATYGLRVGKLALETHAQTMEKLAGALAEVDRAIDARREERDASPTEPTR